MPQLGPEIQKLMTNLLSQAEQSIFLLPGFFFILKRRSQPRQPISIFGLFGLKVDYVYSSSNMSPTNLLPTISANVLADAAAMRLEMKYTEPTIKAITTNIKQISKGESSSVSDVSVSDADCSNP